jgi:hypothetical protein
MKAPSQDQEIGYLDLEVGSKAYRPVGEGVPLPGRAGAANAWKLGLISNIAYPCSKSSLENDPGRIQGETRVEAEEPQVEGSEVEKKSESRGQRSGLILPTR